MKKLLFLSFVVLGSFGLAAAQNAETTSSFSQSELLSFKDVTPVLSAANKGKDYSSYVVIGFNLTISYVEGAVSTKITEPGDGDVFTEKQRELIAKYAGKGASFTLDAVKLKEPGKPGTPYDPTRENVFSVPSVSFSVTK